MASLYGPMAATQLADGSYDRASFLHGLTGDGPPYATPLDDLAPLRGGEGEGVLRGGCLSILAAAAGAPWAPAPGGDDTILFLEDVDERPCRVDRRLLHRRRCGGLAG